MKDATHLPAVPGGGRAGRGPHVGHRPAWAGRCGAVVFLLVVAGLAAGPTAAWAAGRESAPPQYIFHLRSGTQVQTSEYWEEGNEYRLERFGGVIGLNKADVVRIERIQPGARAAPVPAASPAPAAAEPGPEAPSGAFSVLSAYVAEMIDWMRAWVARLWTPRGGETPAQVAQGGATAERGAAPRDQRPPLPLLIALVVAVPILVFGGKRLGGWLFSETRL